MVTLDSIRAARERIRAAVYHSPCPRSYSLSRLCGAEIYSKLDGLQVTGSFKERGARNKLILLKERGVKGVVAASAGNHAQALAYHGRELGVAVTVVMPRWAPLVKVSNCRGFGAEVILHGEAYEEAKRHAMELEKERGLVYVPGFDDADIIDGQGSLGLEILEDVPDVEAIVVPVGGGGLIAGVATAVKALRPDVRIVGVEPANAPTLHESLKAGKVTRIETKPTLADGLAIAEIGKLCFDLIRPRLDDLLLVDEPTIARSVLKLLELEKTMVEGAGAVPLAAAMTPSCGLAGKKVVLVLCGGNIDVTLLARIIERGLAADGRLCRFTVCVGDRPGSLARLAGVLAGAGASILDIAHDRQFGPADPALVTISATCEVRDAGHAREVEGALREAGLV
ncbi:MAG TPA: threonine ammonia-lyase [Tepidisphaeraceae bacterium]|nr:threonine ammonia-lyase [Tepidisphaeraceae bacterium]